MIIDCGGVGDSDFFGGTPYATTSAIDISHVVSPLPMADYQTVRYGSSFAYIISGLDPGATCLLRLHLAEVYFTAPAQRIFSSTVQGVPDLVDFDIVAATGAGLVAMVHEVTAVVGEGGLVVLAFSSTVDSAALNGLEVLGAPVPPGPSPTDPEATASEKTAWDAYCSLACDRAIQSGAVGGAMGTIAEGMAVAKMGGVLADCMLHERRKRFTP